MSKAAKARAIAYNRSLDESAREEMSKQLALKQARRAAKRTQNRDSSKSGKRQKGRSDEDTAEESQSDLSKAGKSGSEEGSENEDTAGKRKQASMSRVATAKTATTDQFYDDPPAPKSKKSRIGSQKCANSTGIAFSSADTGKPCSILVGKQIMSLIS